MTQTDHDKDLTRDRVLGLLSEGEAARVGSIGATILRRGDEYLDLEQLQLGVQRADGVTTSAHALSRKAIQEDTWRRILRQLKPATV